MDIRNFAWTREPLSCQLSDEKVEIVTKPHTDLWQRTYYHFQNDLALTECAWKAHDGQQPDH